ncbi:hypothetical protein CJU89_4277 [Yarrowia sp. B02]|nr:hypothetical protein CJU89_4277 [Yarrowia sp. B02]
MPKLRIRRTRKISQAKKPPAKLQANTAAKSQAPKPPQVPTVGHQVPEGITLAEYSMRVAAQRYEEKKARRAQEAKAAAVSGSTSASTDYVTPVSSQDPGDTPRGHPQPDTYYSGLFDIRVPCFDAPSLPKGIHERDPWKPREPPKVESSQRHQHRPRKSPFRKVPMPRLVRCFDDKTCRHSYCYYYNLHDGENGRG